MTGSPPAHLTWRDVHQDYFAVINEGETLRLNCSVVGDVDEQRRFELNWFLPNAAVEGRLHHDKDKHGNFFSVEVLNAEPDDYGQYKCTGRPDYGYHSEYVEDVERLNAVENAATVTVKVVPSKCFCVEGKGGVGSGSGLTSGNVLCGSSVRIAPGERAVT